MDVREDIPIIRNRLSVPLNSGKARTMRSDRSCALWFGYIDGHLPLERRLCQKAYT